MPADIMLPALIELAKAGANTVRTLVDLMPVSEHAKVMQAVVADLIDGYCPRCFKPEALMAGRQCYCEYDE